MKILFICMLALLALAAISCNSPGSCTGLAACDGDAGTMPPDDSGSQAGDGGDGGEIAGHVPFGEVCSTSTECVPGGACLDDGGTMSCYQVCDDVTACVAGVCTDTELGVKVCVEGGA